VAVAGLANAALLFERCRAEAVIPPSRKPRTMRLGWLARAVFFHRQHSFLLIFVFCSPTLDLLKTPANRDGQLFWFGLSFPKHLRRIHKGIAISVAHPEFAERQIIGNHRLQH
jgi:hypothetical protein